MSNKDRRLKILWQSNGVHVPSGYGVFSRDLLYRLLKDDWNVVMSDFVGVSGGVVTLDGLKVYPRMDQPFGGDAILAHSRHAKADVTFSMQDIPLLDPNALRQLPHYIPYVPVDQEPVPQPLLDNLRFAYRIITFSKFGQKALEKASYISTLIVEGTDPDVFKPQDKVECRKFFNLPQDKFIFGQIGANKENPPRKGWQESLEAFKMFYDKHPDSLYFYQTNQFTQGSFPVEAYAHYLGLDRAVIKIDPYLGIWHTNSPEVSKMINAFDVLLHPSATEGFGLLSIESQSCGTPPIVTDCTSMPELVEDGVNGFVCKGGRKWYSNSGGFWIFADVNSLYDKMEEAYNADRKKIGEAGRKNVLDNYDINKLVKEKWIPYLEQLQTELLGPAPVEQPLPEGVK